MMSKSLSLLFLVLFAAVLRNVNGCGECVCATGTRRGYGSSRTAASRAASSQCGFTRLCDARKGCSCKLMMSDCLASVECEESSGRSGSHRYECTATCSGASRSCLHGPLPTPGGVGDPHMAGFDNTHFLFHGVHGHNYVLFGRKGGDSLVATMRSIGTMSKDGKFMRTYFDEFSIQTSADDKINVALGREGCVAPRVWCPQITINDKLVKLYNENGLRVSVDAPHDMDDVVMVETKESTFSIISKRLRSDDKHLDVHIKLNRVPAKADRYTGILGLTLNRKLGRVVHSRFAAGRDPVALEKELRKSFEVTDKFPVAKSEALSIDGIVRVTAQKMPSSGCQLVAFTIA